ncbi:MAG: tetratricopeptide repeat protein [Deltaproteobacteria bacterium]|nr:tetratricopeptide repeat protein [Deltaproteobacteria bacterium]
MDESKSIGPVQIAAGKETTGGGNLLGFSLEFQKNTALVTLLDRKLDQHLDIEQITLEVPGVRFPFDVAGGAEQFRHHRCRLRTLVISIEQAGLESILVGLLDPARYGFSEIKVGLDGGQGWLSGNFKVGNQAAPFTARFVVEPGPEQSIQVGFMDVRLFGWLPVPATTIVVQLGRALAPLGAKLVDAAFIVFHPLKDLVRWLLPMHGWKIPELSGLRIDRVDLDSGKIRLITVRYPDELPESLPAASDDSKTHRLVEHQYLVFKEGAEAYQKAEKALRDGQLDQARKLYLGKSSVEPSHPHAARRMLEIGVVRQDRFDEIQDLVQDLLSKDADFLPALFARAAMQERQAEAEAGRTFAKIGRLLADRSERQDAVRAHIKAGTLLSEIDSEAAIVNYERILELSPDHIPAMGTLTGLYVNAKKWYRALRMNLRLAHHLEDQSEIAACHVRMGNIFLDRFDDLEKARKHLDAALTHDSENFEALSAQASVQQRRNRPTRAVRLLQKIIELGGTSEDSQVILDVRLRLAGLWEDDLSDPESALLQYEHVLEDHPDHLHSLFRVGSISAELGRWDQASEAFSRLLDLEAAGLALPSGVVKSTVLHLGRIYLSRPDGANEARVFLQRAATIDSGDLTIWQELEKLNRDQADWSGLVDVLEQKAELLSDSEDKLAAILEASRITDRQLGQQAKAEELYRRALAIDPTATEPIEGLRIVLTGQKRWSELVEILVEVASAETDPKLAAQYWAEIGHMRIKKLDDSQEGLQALELAFQLDPSSPDYTRALLLLYRDQNKFEELTTLISEAEVEDWNVEELIDLWLERAAIFAQKLNRTEDAIASYKQALELEPSLLQAHRALADLYFENELWDQTQESVLKVLELAGDGGLSGPGRTELHRRLARVELELGNRQAAIDQLRIVLSRYDGDEEAASQLGKLLRDEERWEELAAFYARQAEHSQGEQAAALHTAAATIWWERLRELEPAAAQYQASVDAEPHSEAVPARLASLQRVYAGLDHWEQVAEVIRKRISLAVIEDQAAMYMALGSILSSRLGDSEAAGECWQAALEVDPTYRPALLMLARRCFEQERYAEAFDLGQRALDREVYDQALPIERRASVALDSAQAAWALERIEDAAAMYFEHMEVFAQRQYADVEVEAFERLELLLRKLHRYEELALVYRRWLNHSSAAERIAGLRRSLALLLFEHLDLPDEAIEVLSEQVQSNPDDQLAVNDLLQMLRKSMRWEQLANILDSQWQRAPNKHEQIHRMEELAELFQFRLHEPDQAIERFKKLLELGFDVAAERLSVIYRQEGMNSELAALLKSLTQETDDPAEAKTYWTDLSRLARAELNDPELALEARLALFSAEPSVENQNGLLDILKEIGDFERLSGFLQDFAEEEEQPERRRDLFLEHAELCFTKADDRLAGLLSLRQAIDIEPDESLVFRAQELYEQEGDFEGAADMQELLVDLAEDQASAARRIHRLGKIFAKHLQTPQRAAAAFEKSCELDPGWLLPMTDLAEIHEAEGNWEKLLDLEQHIAVVASEPAQQADHLFAAAQIAFDKLNDHETGIDLLSRAVDVSKEPGSLLNELADRCQHVQQFSQAADALERLVAAGVEITETAQSPAAIYRRIADLRLKAGDSEAAISAFEQTLRQEPSDESTASQLESLYQAGDRFIDLALMQENLAQRRTGQEAAVAWVAASRSWLEAEDPKAAEIALEQALNSWPDHAAASVLMTDLLSEREAWTELLDLINNFPDQLVVQEEIAAAAHKCWASIKDEPDNPAQELTACRMMLRVDSDYLPALWRTAHLLAESGEADEAESVLRKLDMHADDLDPEQRYELDETLARIDFSRGRTEEAEQRLKRCIEARPDDPDPRTFLHKLYAGGQRFADRVALLIDEAELASEDLAKVEKLVSAAELMEKELGDPKGAVSVYERALQADVDNLDIWRKVVELHRLLDNPDKQRRALLRVAELAIDDEQLLAIRKAARLADDLIEDKAGARQGWSELLAKSPADLEALDRLLDLDRQDQLYEELRQHLQQRLELSEDPASITSLLRELADVLIDKLDESNQAIEYLERLSQLQAADEKILRQLDDLYVGQERWDAVAKTINRKLELAGSELERAGLWLRLANIQREFLDQADLAIDSYKQAAALDLEDLGALGRLREYAIATSDDELLIYALEALTARTPDPSEELSLRRAIGLLKWSAGQSEDARRAFMRAIELDENDAVSRRFLATILEKQDPQEAIPHIKWLLDNQNCLKPTDVGKLKKQLVNVLQTDTPSDKIRALEDLLLTTPEDLDAARQLLELYKESGKNREFADLILKMVKLEPEENRAELWMMRAKILFQEHDLEKVSEAYSQALVCPGEHRHEVACKLAQLFQEELHDEESAARTWELALEIQPEDENVLERLSDLYWSLGRWSRAEETTSKLLERAENEEASKLLIRLGDIYLRQGMLAEAREVFERAISSDVTLRVAYQRLEEVLKAEKQDSELASFYQRWAESAAAGNQRVSLLLSAARHLERMGEFIEAISVLREAIKLDPSNPEAFEHLAPMLSRESRFEEVVEVLKQRRELADSTERRLSLSFEMGEVCKEHIDDLVQAAVHFEHCLQIDNDHAGALEELADIRYGQKLYQEADELYERLGEGGLAASRFVVFFRRGEIAEELGDSSKAIMSYTRSIELNETFLPSRQNLVAALTRSGLYEETVEVLQGLLEVLPDEGFEDMAVEFRLQLGDTFRRLLRFDDAVECYREVLLRDPKQLRAVSMLREYYLNSMDWEQAVLYSVKELELLPESIELAVRWAILGDIYSLRLKDLERAKEAYYSAQKSAPQALGPKWKLWRILRSQADWDGLLQLGRQFDELQLEQDQQDEVDRVIGRALLNLGDQEGALERFKKFLSRGKAELELIEEVASLARDLGDWSLHCSLAGQALESRIKQGLDPEDALESYLILAGVYQEHMGDIDRAAACIRRALELHPREPELLRRLGNLYASDFGTYREAIEVFRELAGMDPCDPELYRYLARLEAARGDIDRTASYYSGLRFLAPMDTEARKFFDSLDPASPPARPLDRSEWDEILLHPSADCLLQRILSVLAPYLEKLFPADQAWIKAQTLVTHENQPALMKIAEGANWLVSGRPVSLYLADNEEYQAWCECSDNPAIVLTKSILERSTPAELNFFVTREIVNVAMGFVLPRKLKQTDLMQLLALLCKMARPEASPPHPLPATAPQYLAALAQVTPPDVMEMVVPLIRRYALEPRAHDIERWASGVRRTANRVALLACGDLIAAMSVLTRFSAAAGGRDLAFIPDRSSVLTRDKDMMALFRFAFSEQFLMLRKKLGSLVSRKPTK